MTTSDTFFAGLGISPLDRKSIKTLSERTGIPTIRLSYYNDNNILPSGNDMKQISAVTGMSQIEIMLRMGIFDHRLKELLHDSAGDISKILNVQLPTIVSTLPKPNYETSLGKLFQGDCIEIMKTLEDDLVDMIFADPPFNLNKFYPSEMDDNLKEIQYRNWCEDWLSECVRVLKPGGSLFVWNLPKWNIHNSEYLSSRLTFKHWISVDIKYSLPISKRLYPSHYSLLYFCKGNAPKVFTPDRLPMKICPKCFCDLTDYGGYKDKMNPDGISLTDVWYDIPPVRHNKYKKRKGANELSVKLMDRIIQLSTTEGDLILDPFGGAGTTYAVAEIKKRRWIGVELGPLEGIIERLSDLNEESSYLSEIRGSLNKLISTEDDKERTKRGLWTPQSIREKKQNLDLFD